MNDRQLIEEIKKLVNNSPIISGYYNGTNFIGDNNQTYTNLIVPDNRNGQGMIVWWQEKSTWLLILSGASNVITRQNIITSKRHRFIPPDNPEGNLKILYAVIDPPNKDNLIIGLYTNYFVGGHVKTPVQIYQFNNYIDANSNPYLIDGVINNYGSSYVAFLNYSVPTTNLANIIYIKDNNIVFNYINDSNQLNYTSISTPLDYYKLLESQYYVDTLSLNIQYLGNLTITNRINAGTNDTSFVELSRTSGCNFTNRLTNYFHYSNSYFNGLLSFQLQSTGSTGDYCTTYITTVNADCNINLSNIQIINSDFKVYSENIVGSATTQIEGTSYTQSLNTSFNFNEYINNTEINNSGSINYDISITNNLLNVQSALEVHENYLVIDWQNAYITNELDLKLNNNSQLTTYSQLYSYNNLNVNTYNLSSLFYLYQGTNKLLLNNDNALNLTGGNDILETSININLNNKPSNISFTKTFKNSNYNNGYNSDSLPSSNFVDTYNLNSFINLSVFVAQSFISDNSFVLAQGVISSITYNNTQIAGTSYVTVYFNVTINLESYSNLGFISFATADCAIKLNNGSIHSFFNSFSLINNSKELLFDYSGGLFDKFYKNNIVYTLKLNSYIDSSYSYLVTDTFCFENMGDSYGQSYTSKPTAFVYLFKSNLTHLNKYTFVNNKIYISYIANDIKNNDANYYVEVWNVTDDGKIIYAPDELITGTAYSLNDSTATILSSSYYP